MKQLLTVTLAVVAATALVAADVADAKRMGGGRSFGAQRQMTPAQPAAPNAGAANAVAPAASTAAPASAAMAAKAAPAAAASGMSRWLGPIAGIAAGLGLAALLSHLGLPEGFGTFLLLALLGVGVFFLIRMFLARRTAPRQPIQYAGAGAGLGTTPGGYETQAPPVGGPSSGKFEPVWAGTQIAAPAAKWPVGFDAAAFAQHAKAQFAQLQAAYDTGDRKTLADVMTPQMFAEVSQEIAARQNQVPTEIVALDAEVLEVVTESDHHWASVRFHGSLREDGAATAQAFDEVWNLTKSVRGSSGWLLAGIQQLT